MLIIIFICFRTNNVRSKHNNRLVSKANALWMNRLMTLIVVFYVINWIVNLIKLMHWLILSLCADYLNCVGNGPSGITLSYMLAGNWPHWNPQDITNHPDELLRARLSCADSKKSLVEQDLVELAEGLEGRSTNPVSLLVRSLTLSHLDNFITHTFT